ncbi:MAG TPA: TonB-dependent receptor [Longimicrobiaceae bacterium]|nr:TonB-dependent receptor [Longimicrobiaceae bacterium]
MRFLRAIAAAALVGGGVAGTAARLAAQEPGDTATRGVREGKTAPITLAPLQVSAIRAGAGTTAASLPIKVDVIEPEQVKLQRGLAVNPTEMLSNLIPSFSPARQKLTSSGESFRGRRPLFLIDGVPQSNPLRDGHRDGFTIDMDAVERVEVVFGANATQGLGATGGIVNYVTVSPPASGALEQRAAIGTTSNDALEGDGLGWRAHYLAAKRFGAVDVLGSFSYERRGLQFDARDRPIAIDNVQGDVADSRSRDFLGKVGWEPGAGQRLQLMVNDFRLTQRGHFESVAGDRADGIPAVSVEGSPEGAEPINDVTTVSLDYTSTGLGGATLSAKGYYQDFSSLFGGGRFDTFQDPAIAPVGELFDQSQNNSRKLGTRLTYARSAVAGTPLDLVAGFDFLRDKTFQRLVETNRNWVPTTKFYNYAPFVQLDLPAVSWLSLSGGLRWEFASLDVPSFTTLAGNRTDFERVRVAGGSPSFDEPLLNVGGVITPVAGLRFYGTLSQAYTMPDVGRVLRGISEEGLAVDDFLDLAPIKTDNLEVGGAYATAWSRIGVTYFESTSDMGSRLVPNSDGIFRVVREPTKTKGWELTGKLVPLSRLALEAGYSHLEGRYDGDDDGVLESDLGAADIGPDRLNLGVDLGGFGRFTGRVQAFHYFDRSFRDGDGTETARFDGYSTVDASVAADLGLSTLTLSVSNLFDAQYITYFGQAATDRDDRYFAGRGRTLTLRLATRF